MRKIYALLVVMGCAVTLKAQLVLNENFTNYTNGNLNGQPVGAPWNSSGVGTDVQVATTTPLGYAGYTSGTQYVTISGSSNVNSVKDFSTSISSSSTRYVYTSFVLRVTSAPTSAASCIRIIDGSGHYLYRFYMQTDGSGNLEFGAGVGTSGNPSFTNGNYVFGTTYLIVIRYDIINNNNNDDVRIWVNPTVSGSAPSDASALVTIDGSSDEDNYGSLTSLQIRQTSGAQGTPVAAFDGFRVSTGTSIATAWTNLAPAGAPLPVKLDNFDAAKEGSSVKLYWNTSDEIGVKAYQVERSEDGLNFTTIGSVTAEKKKTYTFVDAQPSASNNFYRLKMVDFDGAFKMSHVVSIKSKASLNILLSPNPVVDRMLVQHPKAESNNRIQVINTDGKVLVQQAVPANAVQTSIDLSGFRSGLYHVVFQSNSGSFSKTILKQ